MSWSDAVGIVISAVSVYVALLLLIRVFGQRSLAAMSSVDLAAIVAIGPVAGRAILGYTPSLLAGMIGVTTLFVTQTLVRALGRRSPLERLVANRPILVLARGKVLHDGLHRAGMREGDLRLKLRASGVGSYHEVTAVIVERTGTISVIRRGEPIATDVLHDVVGHEVLTTPPDRSAASACRVHGPRPGG
ncbi:DUF421 domain-containing protein [Luedemannella flava]|uniref:DUF421 domain-containing protein n=1 Tax=Luedemannella flava TaxID=349316 RepID=UPI0031CEB24E